MHISIFKFVSAAKPQQFEKKKKKQVMGKWSTSPSEHTSADTICETDIRTRDKPSSACWWSWVFYWDVKFSPHLMFDLAQNELNNLDRL